MTRGFWTFLGVILALVSLSPGGGIAAGSPTEAVKATVDEVLRLLGDPGLKDPARKPRLRQQIKTLVDRRFDYEEMARRTLPNWNQLSAGQRREFVRLFAELLEASYADKLERYSGEKVAYQGESVEGERAEVRTVLIRRNDRIPIHYRLLHKSDWLVYDVVIEGVSLVNNYRSQFSRIISESSYQELVRRLRAKVEETRRLQSGLKPTPPKTEKGEKLAKEFQPQEGLALPEEKFPLAGILRGAGAQANKP